MARNKKVEILSNDKEVLHPMTDGDCVIFEDGQTLAQKLSEDDSVKYTPEIVNSSPMFKVGEGNTVDYSDNVLDGAYERATLQGQTYTNYIQESSADEVTLPTPFTEYERTQHNTLTSDEEGVLGINLVGQSYVNALQHDSEEEYVVLGESLEFQEKKVEYTNEGQIKSAMLKGQTLVNLTTHECFWNGYQTAGENLVLELKNNTKYMFVMNSLDNVQCVSLAGDDWHIHQTLMGTEDNGSYKGELVQKKVFTVSVSSSSKVTKIRILLASVPTSAPDYQVMLLEYQEGMENWDIPYFEGMQSVTVSTRLENLCHKYNSELAKNGKTFNANSLADRCIQLVDYKDGAEAIYGMKPNTKYLIQFKISNLVLDGLEEVGLYFSASNISSGNCIFGENTCYGVSTNGTYRVVLTTTDLVSTSGIEIKGHADQWEKSGSSLRSMTISEIMYVEYQNGMENWTLPYFEDYQVMKPVQIESVNKNLQPNETYSTNSANNVSYIDGSKGLIRINPTKRYRVSAGAEIKGCTMSWYDKSGNYIVGGDSNGLYPITNPNAYYARLHINIDTNYLNTIQVEESDVSTATEYVPHQSKTTYSWDEVILRKVGDVEDTLDLTTGEWVQRIGEITYDGSSDEAWDRMNSVTEIPSGSIIFRIVQADMSAGQQLDNICNTILGTLPTIEYNTLYVQGVDYDCMTTVYSIGFGANAFYLHYKDVTTITELRERLKSNPVKVQYVLTKPIVHKVNLSRPNLQVYDDITHVHTKCLDGTLIPNIYLPSDISYPAILEPGKKYNVSINHTQVSADNPLKVNVGGTEITMTDSRMTLTTPATLANSNVSFTGKGNKIKESMLIKNSSLLTRDLPHFNGIGSVQLGKTIENLCSSKYIKGGSAQATLTDALDTVKITTTTQGSYVLEFPILTPLENGKTYFVYAPVSGGWANYSFVRTYNNSKSYLRQPMGDMMNPQQYIVTIDQLDNQYASLCIGCHGAISVGTTYTITRPILCEYEPGMEDWDWESIGYFTGTKNIGNEFMRVQNKNLIDKSKIVKGVTYNHGGFSTTSEFGGRLTLRQKDAILVKPNSVYSASISPNDFTMGYYLLDEDKNIIYDSGWIPNPVSFLIDKPNAKYLIFNLKKQGGEEIEVSDITSIQLEESSTATTYTAHKHNGLYITKDQPIELTWEQGNVNAGANTSWNDAIQNTVSKRIRTKLITLKPNTSYRVSLGSKNYMWYMYAFNGNNVCPQPHSFNMKPDGFMQTDFIFTTTQQLYKIALVGRKTDDTNITPSEINHIRLEEVTDVVLRGIGDVHDELDITRGIYTQRISEVVLDGSEDWSINHDTNTDVMAFDIKLFPSDIKSHYFQNCQLVCDSFNITSDHTSMEGILSHRDGNNHWLVLTIKRSRLASADVFGLKQYLSKYPIKVQYILASPIINQINILSKNETNTEVAKPNDVFTLPTLYTEQTHINLTNNGIMPKVQSRDYIAYPVLSMIGRTYTLQHNLTGGVSNLTVDLLGRTQKITYQNHKSLVYSPETMDAKLHNELRISGKGKISRVMYIDGGYMDRDIPYIEGMKNAVNPIVKNVGKNLVQKIDNIWYFYDNTINSGGTNYNCGIAPVKPHTQYIVNKNSILCFYDENGKCTNSPFQYFNANSPRTAPSGSKYMLVRHNGGDNATYLDGLQVVEYGQEFDNQEYKENICYVDCGEIRLTPDMFEQGSITVHVNNIGKPYTVALNSDKARIRTKKPINIEPNEQYVIIGDTDKYGYSLHFLDKDENYIGVKAPYELSWGGHKPFTVASDSPKALVFIKRMDNGTITPNDVDVFNFQLVKVSEIKQLRSLPNGVYDEIDLENGTYIQRVGEITLNGSEPYQPGYSSWSNKNTFYLNYSNHADLLLKTMKGDNGSGAAYYDALRCDELHRSYMSRLASANIDGIASYYYSGYQRIFISKQDCATVDELKLWLQENPITVQFELEEPIVKDIVIHNYPHSYEDGHVIIENGDPSTPITAQLTYRAVTNRSGQIQQHTEQVEKQEREINELETLILANIHLSQTR